MARRLSDQAIAILLLAPLIVFEFALSIYPLAYSIYLSFYDINLFKNKWEFVGFKQYARAFTDPSLEEATIVTIRFIAECTVLVVILSLLIALLLNEVFVGRGLLRVLVIMPWAISEFATATVGRYLFSGSYGFLNSLLYRLGLINTYVDFLGTGFVVEILSALWSWHFAPLGIFFILSGLQTIPEDLYKQARVDGASFFARFRIITLPFIKYALLMTLVLATIESARSTDLVFVLTGGGPGTASTTVTYYIYKVFFRGLDLGYGAAISWLFMIGLIFAITAYFIILTRRGRYG